MALRFLCTACQTTMKLAEAIVEPKKVRCSGCGIIILLTPDPNDPLNVKASFPKKTDRADAHSMPASQQKIILLSILGAIGLFLVLVYWYNLPSAPPTPPERAAVQGEVTLNDNKLNGTIVFTLKDETKPITATIQIVDGSYSIEEARGPGIGENKVEITGSEDDTIAPRFKELTVNIQPGPNTIPKFELKSK